MNQKLLQESWYIGGNKYGMEFKEKYINTAEMYLKQNHGAILVEDETGEERLDVLQGMYREFGFPSNVKALRKWLRSPRERRKIFMGIDYNEETLLKKK